MIAATLSRHRYAMLNALAFLPVVLFLPNGVPTGYDAAYGVGILPILVYLWCKTDSKELGTDSPPGAIPVCAILPPIAWLYHVFGTRPWWRALRLVAMVAFVGLALVVLATAMKLGFRV